MREKSGFTVVELVIVMVIMAILMGLGFAVVTRTQANGRDAQRDADMKVVARGLEMRYRADNTRLTTPPADGSTSAGQYPGAAEMQHMMGIAMSGYTPLQVIGGYAPTILSGTAVKNFSPPDINTAPYAGFKVCATSSGCPAVENINAIDAMVTKDMYYYEPITETGAYCFNAGCVRFNLYWKDEVNDGDLPTTTKKLHVIRSERQ